MNTKLLRIVLVDNHTLVRAGIRALLADVPTVKVVAEAADGREGLAMIEQHRPDVVLMDIAMPGMSGLEATAQAVQAFPATRIIILSMHASEEYVLRALRVGAVGYLLKDSGLNELELALQAVARGETYLSPAVSKHVVADYLRRVGEDSNPLEQLTPRQREILQLIAEGLTTKDIARRLELSIKTVETHRQQLMNRLDIHDVTGLVRFAIRVGLIAPE